MKISKQTILLLGALVVLAVGSNLDAAGLKPDRGKGRGTRGKGGSQKKDFQKSAKNAVKALTARIKSDFNLQKGSGPRKFLAAVEGGDVTGFSLLNPLNFTNVKNSANFNAIKTTAGEINTEITQFKDDIKASNTSDNRFIEIEKSASPGGTLYQKYAKFLKDFKTASQPPRNVKTADEAKAEAVTRIKKAENDKLNLAKANFPSPLQTFSVGSDEATSLAKAKTAYDKAVKDATDTINDQIKDTKLVLKAGADAAQESSYDLDPAIQKTITGLIAAVTTAVQAVITANSAVEKAKEDEEKDIATMSAAEAADFLNKLVPGAISTDGESIEKPENWDSIPQATQEKFKELLKKSSLDRSVKSAPRTW